ncbi:MAG: hypothetical protein AAF663_05595, partial [Planctomycetota bacterium]
AQTVFNRVRLSRVEEPDNLLFNGAFDSDPRGVGPGWSTQGGQVGWASRRQVHVKPVAGEAGRLDQRVESLRAGVTYRLTVNHLGWPRPRPDWVAARVVVRDAEGRAVVAQAVRNAQNNATDNEAKPIVVEFVAPDGPVVVSLESGIAGPLAAFDNAMLLRVEPDEQP